MTSGAAPPAGPPPGWYPDPWREAAWRWWDGRQWTGYRGGGRVAAGPTAPAPATTDRAWFPPRGSREPTAEGGIVAVVGFVGGEVLAVVLVLAAIGLGASSRSPLTLLLSGVGLWIGLFGACVVSVRRYGSGSLRDLGLVRAVPGDLGVGALAALVGRVTTIVIAVVVVLAFGLDDFARETSVTGAGVSPLGAVVVVVVVVGGAPFFEELFFRGLVQGVLTHRIGARAAIVVQAVAFAVVHYQIGMSAAQAVLTFSMIAPVGVLLGSLRWRYDRLGPGIAAHAIFNAFAVAVTFAAH